MSNSFTWLPDIPALVQGYRVVAVDLIGDAGLSAPSRPDYASGAYATWLSEVLDVLRIQQCAIAGLSLGGWVGMEFATTHPELVDQLILLAPGGLAAVNHAFLVKQQSQPDHAATMRAVMGDMEPGSVMAKAFEFMILIAENFVPRYDPLPVFTPERLGRLTMPTLVVYGEHDNLLDAPASLANARAGIPEVTTVTLPGVGHAVVGQAKRMLSFIAPGIDQTGHPDRKP
jgi:pimeloyl-ACP methyl ester carboxylesterase